MQEYNLAEGYIGSPQCYYALSNHRFLQKEKKCHQKERKSKQKKIYVYIFLRFPDFHKIKEKSRENKI